MAASDPTAWFLAAVAASKSSGTARTDAADISFEGPLFQRLVEGVHFTKRLMVTYHILIVVIILFFSISHWMKSIGRARRRRRLAVFSLPEPDSPSTSNSCVVDADHHNTISKLDGEDEPLLRSYKIEPPKPSMRLRIKSWLMYQPQPLPIINKDLPSNATSLVVMVLTALNVFYLLFGYVIEKDSIFLFGDRASAIFVGNLPWLYILSAKNQPIRLLTGFSYESLNIVHRRLGELLCLLAICHVCAMVGVWYTILYPLGFTFGEYLSLKLVILGICAFLCYEILYVTSLRSFRRRFYELFLFSHVVLQLAALLLVYFHHPGSRVLVPIAMAIFLADSVLFRKIVKSGTVKANLQIAEDGETVLISAPVKLKKLAISHGFNQLLPLSINYGRKTSQHVFFTVPKLGLQTHPFSIASPPPPNQEGKDEIELIVRAQKGFSLDLLEYSKSHDSANIFLDGPYGSLEGLDMVLDKDVNIVFAAGSGIAVAYPTCRALADDLIASKEYHPCNTRTRKVCLVWVVREQSNLSWIADENLGRLREDGVHVVIPGPTMQYGRPNCAKLLKEIVRSHLEGSNHHTVGILCSGPDSVNRDIRNAASSLASEGVDVDIAIEKYGW